MKTFNDFLSKDAMYEAIGQLAYKLHVQGASADEAFGYIMDNLIIVADDETKERIMLLEDQAPNMYGNIADKFAKVGTAAGHVWGGIKRGWEQAKNSFAAGQQNALQQHGGAWQQQDYENELVHNDVTKQQNAVRNAVQQNKYGKDLVPNQTDPNYIEMQKLWQKGDVNGLQNFMKTKSVRVPLGANLDKFFNSQPGFVHPHARVPYPAVPVSNQPDSNQPETPDVHDNVPPVTPGNESVENDNDAIIYAVMTSFDIADKNGLLNEFLKIVKNA